MEWVGRRVRTAPSKKVKHANKHLSAKAMRVMSLVVSSCLLLSCFAKQPIKDFDETLIVWRSNTIGVVDGPFSEDRISPVRLSTEVESIVDASRCGEWVTLAVVEKGTRRGAVWVGSITSLSFRPLFQSARAITGAAADDSGTSIVYTAFSGGEANPHGFSLFYLSADAQSPAVLRANISPTSSVVWRPMSDEVAYVESEGWIQVLNTKTLVARRVARGHGFSWSPDGSKLAYVNGKTLYVYDEEAKTTTEVYARHAFQTDFDKHIFWDKRGKRILTNAPAGLFGYDNECMITDQTVRRPLYQGAYLCGPVLSQR